MKSRVAETIFDTETHKEVDVLKEELLASYRYNIEALKETYRSRSLTTASIIQLAGFHNEIDLFYAGPEQARRIRKHVDFGCGDGEILIQLFEGIVGLEIAKTVKKLNNESDDGEYSTVYKRAIDEFYRYFGKSRFGADVKKHLIGIDQAPHFIERLNKKGIGARQGSICVSPRKLKKSLGIVPGSVDVAYSTLTLDRVPSKRNLVLNIRRSLSKDGIAIFGLDSDFTSVNDGQGGKEDPINYGITEDWSLESTNVTEMLDKLIPGLVQCGLQPIKLSTHKSRVISTDCITDSSSPNFGPQEYNLVMLVCKKVPIK